MLSYEIIQMMDSGLHPDHTKFPNVISHVICFLVSWQCAATDPGYGDSTHWVTGKADQGYSTSSLLASVQLLGERFIVMD